MNTYLTIMVTILVITQIIRITQNAINLRIQDAEVKRHIDWIDKVNPSKDDFLVQREVMRMLFEKLSREGFGD